MSDFKSQCGCEIHVTQWSSKRKIASVKHCSVHAAAPDLLAALKALQHEVRDVHHLLDVKKRFTLCTADAMAGTAIYKAEGGSHE